MVELSQQLWQAACKLCRNPTHPAMGARFTLWGGGESLIKAGDVERNPGSTTTHNQVRVCEICYKQIRDRKLHNKLSYRLPHSHYNIPKTTMRHIHTTIVSRHLATRGINKILHIPPPHISSSEEILPRLTRRALVQPRKINRPSSNHIYTKSTPNHIHHHYSPFVTLAYTTHIISSIAPTYASNCHPWTCGHTPPE